MMQMWSSLWPLLDISNGISIVFVVSCAAILVYFIFKVRTNQDNMEEVNEDGGEQEKKEGEKMIKIKNPFKVELKSNSNDDLSNGITFNITCDKTFWLSSYWCVNVNDFHTNLRLNWKNMKSSILDSNFLKQSSIHNSSTELHDVESEGKDVIIKPDIEIKPEDLGESPRSVYPLVLVLVYNSDVEDENQEETDAVALFVIVHIKDSLCTMDTTIILQLLKQNNGNVVDLRTLFVPSNDTDDDVEESLACIICQSDEICTALLPCRHACFCEKCFGFVDKCPLCRSYIHSFFRIREPKIKVNMDSEKINNTEGKMNSISRKIQSWFGY